MSLSHLPRSDIRTLPLSGETERADVGIDSQSQGKDIS